MLILCCGLYFVECDDKESSCKIDKLSLGAINELHHMIDDDQDGNVNQQESKGVSSNYLPCLMWSFFLGGVGGIDISMNYNECNTLFKWMNYTIW